MDSQQSIMGQPGDGVSKSSKVVSHKSAVSGGGTDSKAAMEKYKKNMKDKAEQENSTLWQHPFVDVFKHFKILPGSDWKQNKKFGDVTEYFAKEVGRRALNIEGTISANHYISVPHPQGPVKALGLTGRYAYLQIKCPRHGLPFSFHLDLTMAERAHGIRISVSNLFKNFAQSNGFVAQVPLELKNNCWTVVVLDLYELLKRSNILPPTYLIEGSYQVRQFNVCANVHIRGIFTSDNLYDFVTLPADMRFKFAFDLVKWPEYFHWQQLPQDWSQRKGPSGEFPGDENMNIGNLISQQQQSAQKLTRDEARNQMGQEIEGLLYANTQQVEQEAVVEGVADDQQRARYDDVQRQLSMKFGAGPGDHPVGGYIIKDDESEPSIGGPAGGRRGGSRTRSGKAASDYRGGQYSGYELSRSHKLNKDPIIELKHIIGFQPDKCSTIKWSKYESENVVLFTSGGTLIAMDTESNVQKRFFFGHSAPICCFDLSAQGNLIASAQEGKNSLIRIWDYATARCITMTTMPVVSLKCLTFSYDGRYLAGAGKDAHNKELIYIWDISRIQRGDKPERVAKQTSEFNIICLKFSPIDCTRLASCGKENIRFWRIRDWRNRDTANIRGSSVVLDHHARNTVFTSLDFQYGFRSADRDENETMKRLFVGSKHGVVFQVNYQDESLEGTFPTNDAAIYSIAVNDAFCVVGSEDCYLRVWPPDFSEFSIEAQHEGTVSSVDISPDGLKVACGTLYGSIGILDKSNQKYKTLIRSHTDEIIELDFHALKMNIITVSRDRTIRLWDVETFDEVYEFSSPVDQPLCIAAHPTSARFACGFESGKMRIFDIDSTEVVDEFSQFNKALKSLRYDNTGKLLVACCIDGSVSIHNAAREHLPIKMMHLEMAPEFVHVAFTNPVLGADDAQQKFGVVGEYGNNIVIYDTDSFLIQHQITVNNIVKSFKFANNNRDLLVVTKDCKVRFYSLTRYNSKSSRAGLRPDEKKETDEYEGIFLREIANCHRGAITGVDVSANSGYLLTGGEDSMVKIWDYEAQKTVPFYFQSFIGHTYPLSSILFNPRNNGQIISVGARDGVFIWEFNGDIENDYKQARLAGQDQPAREAVEEKGGSRLEELRTANRAKKTFRNQISEDTFIIPQFKPLDQCVAENNHREFVEPPSRVKEIRADKKLPYNHYANCSKEVDIEIDSGAGGFLSLNIADSKHAELPLQLMNGYDGFGGVHDNLIWNVTGGLTYFTLNNKVIIEDTKTRQQTVLAETTVQLSCMAATGDGKSVDGRFLAVGEGSPSGGSGRSFILVFDLERKKLHRRLGFHQKGIQSLAFSYDGCYLVSVGVAAENTLAVWDLASGLVLKHAQVGAAATNQVKMDPSVEAPSIGFISVGNQASMWRWRMEPDERKLEWFEEQVPEEIQNLNFLSVEFIRAPGSAPTALIGADDGSLLTYDQQERQFVDLPSRGPLMQGQIGAISARSGTGARPDTVVVANSLGKIVRYPLSGARVDAGDIDDPAQLDVESAVVALWMDEANNEGLVGTEAGCIHYIDFDAKVAIKLVSSNNQNQDAVKYCKADPQRPQIFLASCGQKSDELKVFTAANCDQVHTFQSNYDEEGHVVFVISPPIKENAKKDGTPPEVKEYAKVTKKQRRLVGFSKGIIKRVSLERLDVDACFRLPMKPGERLTCAQYSENGTNFVIGSSHASLFIASVAALYATRLDINYCRIDNIGNCNSFESDLQQRGGQQLFRLGRQGLNSDIINDGDPLDRLDRLEYDAAHSQDDLRDITGITNIALPFFEPIGMILVSFDDGTIRLWQSSVKNEQLIKILELQQATKKKGPQQPAHYDVAEVGYQQFDLMDSFDLFANPHGIDDMVEDGGAQSKALYSGKKYKSCTAIFPAGVTASSSMAGQYLAYVDDLQYIFIRNYQRREIVKRISLAVSPTCLCMIELTKLREHLHEEAAFRDEMGSEKQAGKGRYLACIGTREGKVLVYRIDAQAGGRATRLYQTKNGLSFGAITAVDVSSNGQFAFAASETGELMQFDLWARLNDP